MENWQVASLTSACPLTEDTKQPVRFLEDRELFLPSTDYLSGRDRTIGAVCVCLSVSDCLSGQ